MDQQATIAVDLKEVRQDIDEIDDQLMALLARRFDLVAQVRLAKLALDEDDPMPLRPAREAMILRRLIENNNTRVPDQLILKLWRNIICQSTLSQSPVQINVTTELLEIPAAHRALADHFIDFPLKPYAKIKMALNAAARSGTELCAVDAGAKWIDHLNDEKFQGIGAILTIPFEEDDGTPRNMIILGCVPGEPTGQDETLVVTQGRLPRDFVPAPLWEAKTKDGHNLTSLPGYLDTSDSPLIGLTTNNPNLALKVMGRYPSPFEV
jgi:chorismate mutase